MTTKDNKNDDSYIARLLLQISAAGGMRKGTDGDDRPRTDRCRQRIVRKKARMERLKNRSQQILDTTDCARTLDISQAAGLAHPERKCLCCRVVEKYH